MVFVFKTTTEQNYLTLLFLAHELSVDHLSIWYMFNPPTPHIPMAFFAYGIGVCLLSPAFLGLLWAITELRTFYYGDSIIAILWFFLIVFSVKLILDEETLSTAMFIIELQLLMALSTCYFASGLLFLAAVYAIIMAVLSLEYIIICPYV